MTVGFEIVVAGDEPDGIPSRYPEPAGEGTSDPDGIPSRYPEPAGEGTSAPDGMLSRYPEPALDGVGEGRWLPYGGGGGRLF